MLSGPENVENITQEIDRVSIVNVIPHKIYPSCTNVKLFHPLHL